jgi:ABC-2 type transport system ATP-binding protein
MVHAITARNVYKQFGNMGAFLWAQNNKATANGENSVVVAVDHVSFEVEEGEIFGLLGPNSSGKSTLIRLISTLLLPDKGDIQVFGFDAVKQPVEVKRLISCISVESNLFRNLSPMENLLYGTRLYGMSAMESRGKVEEILLCLGLERPVIYKPVGEMSRGTRQKIAIGRALLSRPQLLLMDEPTTGLDPRSQGEVQEAIKELNYESGTTILVATQDVVEAESLCDRIAVINRGKIVALDTPEGLRQSELPNGNEPSLEDVFLELSGRTLVKEVLG